MNEDVRSDEKSRELEGGGGKAHAVLKRVSVIGFKSFAHKTELEFAPGITAIVGPNGAGKTNLQEAVRWALGEAGTKAFRVKKSDEVIFGGSDTRRAIGMSEVVLHIDNSSRRLPIPFEEVEIARRLYRNGENEYLINRAKVRLRDLEDLLAGANLADNPFVFIRQGLVDQVLSLRPQDRRIVIEEAAGTRRLELRRLDALSKIAAAETELTRVNDILREIGPRRALLEEQAGRWREYEGVRGELRRRALRWYRDSYAEAASGRDELRARVARVDAEMAGLGVEVAGAETAAVADAETLARERQEDERARQALEAALADEASAREELAGLRASLDAVREQREQVRASLARLQAEKEAAGPGGALPPGGPSFELDMPFEGLEREGVERERASVAGRLQAAREALDDISRRIEALASETGALRAEVARLDGDHALTRGQSAALEDALGRAREEIELRRRALAGEAPPLPDGLWWLFERVAVPADLELAVRAAVGGRVAVADSIARAAALRAAGIRGVTVVEPRDGERRRDAPGVPLAEALEPLDPAVRPIVRAALADVRLVDDEGAALTGARGLGDGVRLVTRDGLVVSPGRAVIAPDAADELAARRRLAQVEEVAARFAREAEVAQRAASDLAEQRDGVARSLAAREGALHEAQLRRAALEREARGLVAEEERLRDARRLATERERVATLESREAELAERATRAQTHVRELGQRTGDARRSWEDARARALAAEGSRRESEELRARARERMAELRGERGRLAAEEERANAALRLLDEQVRAELGLADEDPLPDPASIALGEEEEVRSSQQGLRELQRLRRKLIGLEPVNPLAESELTEVAQRHDFLTAQRDDLERAITDLRALGEDLARTIAEQFSATLQAVDREFAAFFTRLFNGGTASLRVVTDDEGSGRPSETGIDIVARPPGKRLSSLAQLSGGERALTATALLLAILRVRPAPFCVLDEVDAALDERNVGRFNEALRDLTDRTQFIIITHNRGTIEAADALYGVSMDASGVSKVVSLRLADLDKEKTG